MTLLFGGLATIIVIAAAVLAFSAYSYDRALAIETPNGISEAMYVRIGGIDQWIQIRGRDRNNPILLWLNGGPGFSTIGATVLYPKWERDFTIVMWDQRGEGKTFEKSGLAIASTMSIYRIVDDGIEVAGSYEPIWARKRWGSILGAHMAAERPDLFAAYIGTGQVVQVARGLREAYPGLVARAREQHNDAASDALTKIPMITPTPGDAVGPPSAPPAVSSVTSSSTKATVQASSPNANDFFNSLLVRSLNLLPGRRARVRKFHQRIRPS